MTETVAVDKKFHDMADKSRVTAETRFTCPQGGEPILIGDIIAWEDQSRVEAGRALAVYAGLCPACRDFCVRFGESFTEPGAHFSTSLGYHEWYS